MKITRPEKHIRIKRLISPVLALALLFSQAGMNPAAARQAADTITIHGTVSGEDGESLRALISVNSASNEYLATTETSSNGSYSLQVPSRDGYVLWAQEVNGRVRFGADTIPTGYMDLYQYAAPDGIDLAVDLILHPAGAIWLQAYDPSGQYLFLQDVNNNSLTAAVYPLGTPPTGRPLQYLNHQTTTFWGWRDGSAKNHPVVQVTPDLAVELWVWFRLPEVGDTYLHLDNNGNGFTVEQGEVLRVNILYEAARTEYRIFHQRLESAMAGGYEFTDAVTQRAAEAGTALQSAGDQCVADQITACIASAYTVLTNVILGREELVLQVARQDIESIRKQDVTIQLLDCNGALVSGQAIEYQQVSHDFIFGVGWPDKSELASVIQAGFNGVIEEAWWGEVIPDGIHYNYLDENFSEPLQQGLDIVMHTGVWITPAHGYYFHPPVIENMTPAEIADLAGEFSERFTAHYRDDMLIYDSFNEPQNAFFTLPLTLDDVVAIAAASEAGAGRGAPDVPTYINFYNAYLGGDMSWVANPDNANFPSPQEILDALLAAEIPFDNIGLEFYSGVVPTTDFGIFNDTLEHYGQYGKDVFISEISYGTDERIPSRSPYLGDWHSGHTDQTQAEWALYAYTIAFSKPYITGVVWVPASDRNSPAEMAGLSLYDGVGRPRPVVDTISRLIQSWTSSGSGETDGNGALTWRGFTGEYELRWTDQDGIAQTAKVHVSQGTDSPFVLQPSGCELPTATPGDVSPTFLDQAGGLLYIVLGIGILGLALLIAGILLLRRKAP